MKPLTLVLTVMVCLPALADEPKPWPQKGDTVYVASELNGIFGAPPVMQYVQVRVPACLPLSARFQPKPDSLILGDDTGRGGVFKFCAGWEAWIYSTQAQCKEAEKSAPVFQKKKGCYSPAH